MIRYMYVLWKDSQTKLVKIYSLSKFQVQTVLLTIVTMQYIIRFSELAHVISFDQPLPTSPTL